MTAGLASEKTQKLLDKFTNAHHDTNMQGFVEIIKTQGVFGTFHGVTRH